MSEIIVKKNKVQVMMEWTYSDDASLVEAVRNAQELKSLVAKDAANEQDSEK